MNLAYPFQPNHTRYDGVRPVNIYLLRLLFILVFVFVGSYAWGTILRHEGAWEPVRAAAICMWASYSALSLVGVLYPLKMLPIVLFEILYKLVWLAIVAYPLWSAGQLAGSPAAGMASDFAWVLLPIVATPWGYVVRHYLPRRRVRDPIAEGRD